MTRQIPQISKRIVPLMLAIMLIASAVFVPTVVSADPATDPYAEVGLHAPTVFDFNDGIPAYITAGDGMTVTSEDGAMLVTNHGNANANRVLFEAYSDIETLSLDFKMASIENGFSPAIVLYDETYTADDTTSVNAFTRMDLGYNNGWYARVGGTNIYTACGTPANKTLGDVLPENFDITQEYLTLTVTYGDSFTAGTSSVNQKYITNIAFSYNDEVLVDYNVGGGWYRQYGYYGVDKTKKADATDNEKVYVGFASNAWISMYVDNIEITYRNAPKVIDYIDAIGDVTADATCLAKIEKAETAYALLSADEQAKVTNHATLTAARVSYDELIANADVTEVVNKIAAIGTVDASDECLAKIEAAEDAYAALAPEKQAKVTNYSTLTKARASYVAAKYGIHSSAVIDFKDYSSITANVDGNDNSTITSDTLPLTATKNQEVYYDVYGDISTFSYDLYVDSTATTGTVDFPYVYYYIDSANSASDSYYFSLQDGNALKAYTTAWSTPKNSISYSDYLQKWLTVKFEYSSLTSTHNGVTTKYISEFTIIDKETNTELLSYPTNSAYLRYLWKYGADLAANPDAKDSDVVKIGFKTNGNAATIKNVSVTYRDNASKVIGYIDAIGEVEVTDDCLAKIVYAEEAYALLSDTEKAAVTNYATLTAAKDTYNNLVENADVIAVQEKIAAIGAVDASDECLAKIEAAEEAYEALSPEKQALVSNHDVLVKARADYEEAYLAQLGIHTDKTIDLTEYTDASTVATDGITATELSIPATKGKDIYYQVYGDIKTFSYDIYLDGDATATQIDFPQMHYYGEDGMYLSLQTKAADGTKQLKYNNGWEIIKSGVDFADFVDTTLNITLEYSTKDELFDRAVDNGEVGKYIKKITVTDKASGTELICYEPSDNYRKYLWKYGVNYYDATTETNDMTKQDPEVVTIGFGTPGNYHAPATISNLSISYYNTAAAEKVGAIETFIVDNSADCEQTIADIKATYALLPETMKTEKLTAAIASAEATLEVIKNASADAAPKMNGATIRATLETGDQNIRYNSSMPTADIDGYSIVEYGTVMFPNQLLNGQELTLDTTYNGENVISAKSTVEEGAELPTDWNSELYGIDTADSMARCGLRIAARSYIKYSDGNNTFILYSSNDVDGYDAQTAPTVGVNDGVCVRSVFSVARAMTTALLDTDKYSEEAYGDIVYSEDHIASKDDYANATGVDAITFVFNNQTRLGKIVDAR
ncbi:MAG: hypothetical protein J6J39_05485 [Clostridia bacterium]|nr:hypothetical protein [Clostridia bacterium]